MDHVIAYGQLGKALDMFPFISRLFPLPFFPLRTEHVAFGDNYKFNLGIFKSFVEVPVCHKDFPRLYLPVLIVRAKGTKPVFPQIPGQAAGPGTGSGQQDNPVFFLLPPLQVFDEQFETVLIRIDIFHVKLVFCLYGQPRQFLLQPG